MTVIMRKIFGFDNHPADSRITIANNGIIQTLSSRMGTGGGNVPICLEKEVESMDIVRRLTPLECERLQGYPDNWTLIGKPKEVDVKDYQITYREEMDENGEPQLEVESKILTGTHKEIKYFYIDEDGKEKEVTDSARYKALGNSIALPQWYWIEQRMAKFLPKHATLGSLFDGIGGFPLTWEEIHGKGTARWASEIEPFPIAVTKFRFPEE